MTTQLEKWVSTWIPTLKATKFRILPLAGDGSTRSFSRLQVSFAPTPPPPDKTFVVLWDPEWSLSKDYPAHQAYLRKVGIPVPEFHTVDVAAGCLVMEDLGDELLQHRILSEPDRKMKWLDRAIRLLAQLHGKTYPVPKDLPVATRSFDQQKYLDEFLFTFEHLSTKYLGLPALKVSELETLKSFCRELAAIRPLVFCHRDYHTRNILVKAGRDLVLIDFQDARTGPPHYDLASLLYDPYVPLTENERLVLLSAYREELAAFGLPADIAEESFSLDLGRIAFQRMVKAAGSFASFFTRYGKTSHLPYLAPALQTARALTNIPGMIPDEVQPLFKLDAWLAKAERQTTGDKK